MRLRYLVTVSLAFMISNLAAFSTAAADRSATEQARHILHMTGVSGGLVVHLGCDDGRLTAALRQSGEFLVHGLDADAADVRQARGYIRAQNLYGQVSVERWTGTTLPYVDNVVALLVAEAPLSVPMQEITRVLRPRGVACIKTNEKWTQTTKPWPGDRDEWTHFLHGPDNNAVADDTTVGPPRRMQWLAGPKWTRHHDWDKGTRPGFRALVSANGRLFYMVDEATAAHRRVPSRWFLVARDAFSGVRLWKKRLLAGSFPRRLEQLWRSMIADSDRLYTPLAPGEPLAALDAATGKVLQAYEGTKNLEEVIKSEDVLFAVTEGRRVVAVRASSGEILWEWKSPEKVRIVPLTLAASGGRVFLKTDKSVICLSAGTGKRLWRFEPEIDGKRRRLHWPRARLIVKDGVVLCSYGGKDPGVLNRDRWAYLGAHPRVKEYNGTLAALSAETGEVLWKTPYRPGLESYPGDIFIIDGLVWPGPDFARALDLHTGEVRRKNPIIDRLWTTGHHHRCYPEKATSRYILNAKRGVEFIDLVGDGHSRNNWVRGTCRTGLLPCNGLLYAPPHSCGCYMEAKLYGFWALSADRETGATPSPARRLEKGPAYGKITTSAGESSGDPGWPVYRHDSRRSGVTPSDVPDKLECRWQVRVGKELTAPVVAGGRVVVSDVDSHRLVCLDSATGEAEWDFTTGGRVDSPPSIYKGMVLAGCADGCVYCLRLSDGALIWRFLAAPDRCKTVAYGQLESVWPVHGSILVSDGVAYAAAGRCSYLDGGIMLYGLDAETGRVVHESELRSAHPKTPLPEGAPKKEMGKKFAQNKTDYKTFMAPDRSDAFSMSGGTTDVMTAGKNSLYLRHLRLDENLSTQDRGLPHLFSTSRLLDGTESHRAHWVYGTGDFSRTVVAYPWIAHSTRGDQQLAVPYGLMLCFDDDTVWGVRRLHMMRRKTKTKGNYMLFAQDMPARKSRPDFRKVAAKERPQLRWTVPLSLRPRAMVRAGSLLFVGGMPDEIDPKNPKAPCNATFEGRGAGLLQVISPEDGSVVDSVRLDAPPVWDGMAAARSSLFMSLRSGTLARMTAPTSQ